MSLTIEFMTPAGFEPTRTSCPTELKSVALNRSAMVSVFAEY